MTKKKRKGLSWPVGIIIVYAVFMLFMFSYLAFTQSIGVDLVAEDYYSQEIEYQKRIDSIARTKALTVAPQVFFSAEENAVVLEFHPDFLPESIEGHLTLMRPSNVALDFKTRLQFDAEGRQTIDARKLHKGLWKAMLEWQLDGLGYYFEEKVIVP